MSERINFGKLKEAAEPPNLIEVQLNSYVEFLQKDVPPSKRKETGLQAVFKEVFPITSYDEKVTLDFVTYEIGDPKLSALESQREGQTFSAPLHVTFQLKEEKGTKEEKVYMGEIPLMTPQGTFVINGAERVVVSPAAPLAWHLLRVHASISTARCFTASASFLIAARGWKSSSTRTICSTSISTAANAAGNSSRPLSCARLGYGSDEEIIKLFYTIEDLDLSDKLEEEQISSKVLISDVRDGEITVARAFEPLTKATVRQILALGVKSVKVVETKEDDTIIKSLKKDPAHDEEEALKDIYRRLRPGDPPTVAECARLAQTSVFRSEKIRSRPRRPLQAQPEAWRECQSRPARDDQRGLHRGDEISRRSAPWRRNPG